MPRIQNQLCCSLAIFTFYAFLHIFRRCSPAALVAVAIWPLYTYTRIEGKYLLYMYVCIFVCVRFFLFLFIFFFYK